MELLPQDLLRLQRRVPLPEELYNQVQGVLTSPHIVRYLGDVALECMLNNTLNLDNEASADFMRGMQKGVLYMLNEIVDHVETIPELEE